MEKNQNVSGLTYIAKKNTAAYEHRPQIQYTLNLV